MIHQCPKCELYTVEFDSHFQRPRCHDCGWLPSHINLRIDSLIFELCDNCYGYSELVNQCDKCNNTGKVLNSLGREIVELIKEVRPK